MQCPSIIAAFFFQQTTYLHGVVKIYLFYLPNICQETYVILVSVFLFVVLQKMHLFCQLTLVNGSLFNRLASFLLQLQLLLSFYDQ